MDPRPDADQNDSQEYGSEVQQEDSIYKHHYIQAKERNQAQSLERPHPISKQMINP
jgi:hypothetical protein